MIWKGVLIVVVLVTFVADGSDASLLAKFQKLTRTEKIGETVQDLQVSPSPSPIPSINAAGGHAKGSSGTAGAPAPAPAPRNLPKREQVGSNSHEMCKESNMSCHNQNITACVIHSTTAPTELVLVVYNDGEDAVEVDVAISPVNNTLKEIHRPKIQILKHQMERMNVSEYAGSPLITVNGDCLIHMASPPATYTEFLKQFRSFPTQVTPIHGVYLLSLTVLIIGGTWACCKLGKERKDDGVPYQELEMGKPDSLSTIHVETAEGWDQGWDDEDWDLENPVKTPGENNLVNGSANGHTAKSSNKDGWEDDWDY